MHAPAGLAHHLTTMAYQNAWANHRLGKACARLSQEEFVATRTSFFPSIKATLNHIVTVDFYYLDALECSARGVVPETPPDAFFDPEEPYATAREAIAAQRGADERLVAFCRSLDAETVMRTVAVRRRTGIQHESTTRLLSHVFEHQIHHRGQVHAMLSGTSVPPPQLDEFFCANEAGLRASDFAELGFTEAMIWGD